MALTKDTVIGFIGTGVMGKSMAANLMKAGYRLNIYTRTKEKAEDLLKKGAAWKQTAAELAAGSDVVITIVGYPHDVEELYFGDGGILANAKPGSYVIDMTTSKPKLAEEISQQATKHHIYSLDAPVSGGDVGARNGTLAIMAGGAETAYQEVLPILETLGENVVYQGGAGAGQHTKMSNQITIASNMIGVCESITYAERAGLDPERVLNSISTGAAGSWSLSNLAPRMIADNYDPGFYVKHFIKDMKIALESAEEMGLLTPGLKLSLSLYQKLAEDGEENSGTQALIKLFK
ncbi:NAD(P)-dependent oxidoreductase [Sediminibacillus albus]|uniref:3-hydroxyisobutyrate dehydrogenase n=1 Tax=Sediminibacillus albus TaxID=407036 RepID=A0A1G9AS33_9BACI|nr:NAD(P)-dependent oxidoreductase [Sediminibacillus albus]SDK30128.1 3-hydroxyisobutyrate dehydrogenase [Sediminibacillus albus]